MSKKYVRGIHATPPKYPGDQGPVYYYDGMEGGNERVKELIGNLKSQGYKVKITDTGKTKKLG